MKLWSTILQFKFLKVSVACVDNVWNDLFPLNLDFSSFLLPTFVGAPAAAAQATKFQLSSFHPHTLTNFKKFQENVILRNNDFNTNEMKPSQDNCSEQWLLTYGCIFPRKSFENCSAPARRRMRVGCCCCFRARSNSGRLRQSPRSRKATKESQQQRQSMSWGVFLRPTKFSFRLLLKQQHRQVHIARSERRQQRPARLKKGGRSNCKKQQQQLKKKKRSSLKNPISSSREQTSFFKDSFQKCAMRPGF